MILKLSGLGSTGDEMDVLKIYTDGACSKNPGPGGYAAVYFDGKKWKRRGGFEQGTTNNRMELEAFHTALKIVDRSNEFDKFEILMDSAYVYNSVVQGWVDRWSANGWKTKAGKPVVNVDIWKKLYLLLAKNRSKVELKKVKGHSGIEGNEIADDAAVFWRDYATMLLLGA